MTQNSENIDTNRERRSSSEDLPPSPPQGPGARRAWAIRRYHGIGPNGGLVEEWTASEVAASLDVSGRTVRRWANEEPIPLVQGWSAQEKMTLYACVLAGDREGLLEYLRVQRLLDRESDSRNRSARHPRIQSLQSADSNSEDPPEEFDPDLW